MTRASDRWRSLVRLLEDFAQEVAKYDLLAIPVVDAQNRMVGIVTHDDVADVVREEAAEDFHLTAGISPLAKGYGHSGVWPLYHRRIGWLVILVFVNLVSSGVIAAYEEVLAVALTLAFFLPLPIDSGGNTGAQAATLIIRALATGEITLRQWWKVVVKELMVGLSLGLTMAVASRPLITTVADASGLLIYFTIATDRRFPPTRSLLRFA